MGNIRARKESDYLYFDFQYQGIRCREQTKLKNTPANYRKLELILKKIEKQIRKNVFQYADFFPDSPRSQMVSQSTIRNCRENINVKITSTQNPDARTTNLPMFNVFSKEWYKEKEISWKQSYKDKITDILNLHLRPYFGNWNIIRIDKAAILKFRVYMANKNKNISAGLSNDRINQTLNLLKQITDEAADRYQFNSPYRGIKPLRTPRTKADPFSLKEVGLFLDNVEKEWQAYYTLRFFTGMRTSEIDGLKWKYIDFDRKQIHIKETLVKGEIVTTKTETSERFIEMSTIVYDALIQQKKKTYNISDFVFCTKKCTPLLYRNVSNRIWYPLLKKLDIKRRRPYQTRHTAATLWLAAGESPEWIARQMGHSTAKMLFTIYSRYVPNLTRQDGSAFERLLQSSQFSGGKS